MPAHPLEGHKDFNHDTLALRFVFIHRHTCHTHRGRTLAHSAGDALGRVALQRAVVGCVFARFLVDADRLCASQLGERGGLDAARFFASHHLAADAVVVGLAGGGLCATQPFETQTQTSHGAVGQSVGAGTFAGQRTGAQMVLFASLLVWAVLSFRAARQRDALAAQTSDTPDAHASHSPAPNISPTSALASAITLLLGAALWAALLWHFHAQWFGVSPLGAMAA